MRMVGTLLGVRRSARVLTRLTIGSRSGLFMNFIAASFSSGREELDPHRSSITKEGMVIAVMGEDVDLAAPSVEDA